METVEYYTENGKDCYLLLLDASKAFDLVEDLNYRHIIICLLF